MYILYDIRYLLDFKKQKNFDYTGLNVPNILKSNARKLTKFKIQVEELREELEKCKTKACLGENHAKCDGSKDL